MTLIWRKVGNNWKVRDQHHVWWVLDNPACIELFMERMKGML